MYKNIIQTVYKKLKFIRPRMQNSRTSCLKVWTPSKRNCRLIPRRIQTKNSALRYLPPGTWKATPAIQQKSILIGESEISFFKTFVPYHNPQRNVQNLPKWQVYLLYICHFGNFQNLQSGKCTFCIFATLVKMILPPFGAYF